MSHIKQQAREAARDIIAAALPGDTVSIGRVRPVDKGTASFVGVYAGNEVVAEDASGGEQTRVFRLRVDITALGDEDAALAALDDRQVAVEQAFAADPRLGGTVNESTFVGADTVAALDGEKPLFVLTLNFDLTAYTVKSDPENILT